MGDVTTKYGNLDEDQYIKYKSHLINQIFKLLPMKQENDNTLNIYLTSLLFKIIGLNEVLGKNPRLISLISRLEGLVNEDDFKVYRREVLKCISIVEKL